VPSRKLKYPIIGGPLDGKHANYSDWRPSRYRADDVTVFEAYSNEYRAFNNANGRLDPAMVWLHVPMLKPAVKEGT